MRIGGPLFKDVSTPEKWIGEVKRLGHSAVLCPLQAEARDATIYAYRQATAENHIVISEVGAWSNPISSDRKTREKAVRFCQQQLKLADRIGAGCCVNIAGSRGTSWDGPDSRNFTSETFDMIVESVRDIYDEVNPVNTYYCLEMMPWIFPDSAESYLALIKAIDRERIAVHFDPVNMITSPRDYFNSDDIISDFIKQLGPYIKNVHAKDIKLQNSLTVHLDEVIPGEGILDYHRLLTDLNELNTDLPIMVEHLETEMEYRQAADYIRKAASECKISL